MICYKDITYCMFYQKCKRGKRCVCALTQEVLMKADTLGLPICQYTSEPDCYEKVTGMTIE